MLAELELGVMLWSWLCGVVLLGVELLVMLPLAEPEAEAVPPKVVLDVSVEEEGAGLVLP